MQAAIEVDIIVYEQEKMVCIESFTPRGEQFLREVRLTVKSRRITVREALEDSDLRYEIVRKPS